MKDRLKYPDITKTKNGVYLDGSPPPNDIELAEQKIFRKFFYGNAEDFGIDLEDISNKEFQTLLRTSKTGLEIVKKNEDDKINLIRHGGGYGKSTSILRIQKSGVFMSSSLKQLKSKYQDFQNINDVEAHMLVGFRTFTGYETKDGNFITYGNEKEAERKVTKEIQDIWKKHEIDKIRKILHTNDLITAKTIIRLKHKSFWKAWKKHNNTEAKVLFISQQRLPYLERNFDTATIDEGVEDVKIHSYPDGVKNHIMKPTLAKCNDKDIQKSDIKKIPITNDCENFSTSKLKELRLGLVVLLKKIRQQVYSKNGETVYQWGSANGGKGTIKLLNYPILELSNEYKYKAHQVHQKYQKFYGGSGVSPYNYEIARVADNNQLPFKQRKRRIRAIEQTKKYCEILFNLLTNKILAYWTPNGDCNWYGFTPKIFWLYYRSNSIRTLFLTDATAGKKYLCSIGPSTYDLWNDLRPKNWVFESKNREKNWKKPTANNPPPRFKYIGHDKSNENLNEANLETDHIQVNRSFGRSENKETWRNDELMEGNDPTDLGKEIIRAIAHTIEEDKKVLCVGKKSFSKNYQEYFENTYPNIWKKYKEKYDMKLFWYFDELEGENVAKDADKVFIFQCKRLGTADYFRLYLEQYNKPPPSYINSPQIFKILVLKQNPGVVGLRSKIDREKAISMLMDEHDETRAEVLSYYGFLDTDQDEIFLGHWNDLFKRNVEYPNFDAGFRKRDQKYASGEVYYFSLNPRNFCNESISEEDWITESINPKKIVKNWDSVSHPGLYRSKSFMTNENKLKSWAKSFQDLKLLEDHDYSRKEAFKQMRNHYPESTLYRHRKKWESL